MFPAFLFFFSELLNAFLSIKSGIKTQHSILGFRRFFFKMIEIAYEMDYNE